MNGDGSYVYGYFQYGIKNVFLGSIPLFEGQTVQIHKSKEILTGEIAMDDHIVAQLNGEDIPVSYEENYIQSTLFNNIYASSSDMKKFKIELLLNKNKINKIKLIYQNKEYNYQVKVVEKNKDYLNETDLSIYSKVIFVDAVNGNDDTGNGSLEKPYQTFDMAYQQIIDNANEALYLKKGTYVVSVPDTSLKRMSIIGEGKGTILHFNHATRRIQSRDGIGISNGTMYDISDIHFYRLTFKSSIPSGDNLFMAYRSSFYNIAFDITTTPSQSILSGVSETKFVNCLDVNSTEKLLRNIGIMPLINCYGAFNTYSVSNVQKTKSITVPTANIDENYRILDNDWKHAGTGINRDGTQAHIGLYGGLYAW